MQPFKKATNAFAVIHMVPIARVTTVLVTTRVQAILILIVEVIFTTKFSLHRLSWLDSMFILQVSYSIPNSFYNQGVVAAPLKILPDVLKRKRMWRTASCTFLEHPLRSFWKTSKKKVWVKQIKILKHCVQVWFWIL